VRRTPIRRRSKKESERLRRYDRARTIVMETANGMCEAVTNRCMGPAGQVHHRRGRDGELVDDLDNLLAVCYACHDYIHSHPHESYERGWMIKRNGESSEHYGRTDS
jgi:hypothetical protein